jgi:tripartite-type tricarboxylate transporter receptor subunit TctC
MKRRFEKRFHASPDHPAPSEVSMPMHMFRAIALLAVAAVLVLPLAAGAQNYPTKQVVIINPNLPGGAIEILARLLQQQLGARWNGRPVIVENKPGAGTVIGTDFVAKSAPDGHTLGMVVTSHVINPSMRPDMPFDTLKDLSGVTMIAVSHILISANPSFPPNNIAELIAYAKKNPGKLAYASPGSGSSMHLAGELLKTTAGIDMLHVPFKGSGPAYIEVMSGRIPLIIDPLFSSMSYVRGGKMKPIAVTNPQRSGAAKDIPTVAETIPGFSVQSIFGMVVPSATPRELVKRINGEVVAVLKAPELRAKLSEVGLEVVGNSPEEFDAFIRSEIDKWAKVVKASGAKPD